MFLSALRAFRQAYAETVAALPWLDAARWDDDPPAFPDFARDPALPAVRRLMATPALAEALADELAARGPLLVVYRAELSGPLAGLTDLLQAMTAHGVPLVVLHTDVPPAEAAKLASSWPELPVIIESGPLKLLYHITELEHALAHQPNLYVCTWNLGNWLGLESLCAAGLGRRLLFGTHAPRYNAHVSMGPIALGRLDWETKRGLAGDNLRRLLELPLSKDRVACERRRSRSGERSYPPFVIDSHAHIGPNGRFPTPDEGFAPADWLGFMDDCCLEQLYLCPMQAIDDPWAEAREFVAPLLAAAPGRFRYFVVFSPAAPEMLPRLRASLADPACAGIKIHPSMHGVAADDPAYAPVYELAQARGVPLLTHSWEASATNPVQHLSHPARFRRHLEAFPDTKLVLGHAGGRPSTIEEVTALCRDFPRVRVDLAGDYFDSGLVEMLVARLGVERVLFASDMNWMDPRAMLGAVLGSSLDDEGVLRVLRTNVLQAAP